MRKLVEYAIYYADSDMDGDGDVDHVPWYVAKRMLKNPPDDVVAIYRVTRWWRPEDERLVREQEEVLFSRYPSYGNVGDVFD